MLRGTGGEEEPAEASEKEPPAIQREHRGHGALEAIKRKFTENKRDIHASIAGRL